MLDLDGRHPGKFCHPIEELGYLSNACSVSGRAGGGTLDCSVRCGGDESEQQHESKDEGKEEERLQEVQLRQRRLRLPRNARAEEAGASRAVEDPAHTGRQRELCPSPHGRGPVRAAREELVPPPPLLPLDLIQGQLLHTGARLGAGVGLDQRHGPGGRGHLLIGKYTIYMYTYTSTMVPV